jgi:hypothetical protein
LILLARLSSLCIDKIPTYFYRTATTGYDSLASPMVQLLSRRYASFLSLFLVLASDSGLNPTATECINKSLGSLANGKPTAELNITCSKLATPKQSTSTPQVSTVESKDLYKRVAEIIVEPLQQGRMIIDSKKPSVSLAHVSSPIKAPWTGQSLKGVRDKVDKLPSLGCEYGPSCGSTTTTTSNDPKIADDGSADQDVKSNEKIQLDAMDVQEFDLRLTQIFVNGQPSPSIDSQWSAWSNSRFNEFFNHLKRHIESIKGYIGDVKYAPNFANVTQLCAANCRGFFTTCPWPQYTYQSFEPVNPNLIALQNFSVTPPWISLTKPSTMIKVMNDRCNFLTDGSFELYEPYTWYQSLAICSDAIAESYLLWYLTAARQCTHVRMEWISSSRPYASSISKTALPSSNDREPVSTSTVSFLPTSSTPTLPISSAPVLSTSSRPALYTGLAANRIQPAASLIGTAFIGLMFVMYGSGMFIYWT